MEELERLSLSVMSRIRSIHKNFEDVRSVLCIESPVQLANHSDTLLEKIRLIEQDFIPLRVEVDTLRVQCLRELSDVRIKIYALIQKVEERDASELQPNNMVSLYSEDTLYYRILNDSVGGKYVKGNIELEEIKKPEEFSVISIISAMKQFPGILDDVQTSINDFCKGIGQTSVSATASTLMLKNLLDSYEFMTTMNTETKTEESEKTLSRICDLFKVLECPTEHKISELFRVFLAIKSNKELFKKATITYTQAALESAFNPDSRYEIL